ncbi:MAG TPA: hypothetical protein VF658_21315 [Pyrinomonadaceae bacterium]|jgi:hypothetical protein
MMKYASKLTLEAHYNNGLVMWSGGVGRGKTSCAEWMVDELNVQFDPLKPDTFRLKHYEVGRIAKWSGREEKIALRSLYHATIGPMDEGVYRTFPLEAIAEIIVHGLRKIGCQMIFVDEAGRLSLNALDALVLVSDTARITKWPLTIVIIGMDDLPVKIKLNERIYSRVHQKVCFEPYKPHETWDLLAALDPYFVELDRKSQGVRNRWRSYMSLLEEIREQLPPLSAVSSACARDIPTLILWSSLGLRICNHRARRCACARTWDSAIRRNPRKRGRRKGEAGEALKTITGRKLKMSRNKDPEQSANVEFQRQTEGSSGKNSADVKAPSSKLRKGLLRSHQIVLRSLEVANLRLSRVATVTEIAECMLPSEVVWIGRNYAKELCMVISSILGMLTKRGLVFSPGRIGKHKYYGSTSILDSERSSLPDAVSRRRRVLGIVYRAVEHFGRAVRNGDVLDFVAGLKDEVNIDAELITRDLLNLSRTGEITVVGTVRGDEKGINLYLPSDLNPDSYMPTEPLTWLEEVAQAFTELWEEELNRATGEGRRPRPISIEQVRSRIAISPNPHPNLSNLCYLPNALLQLAEMNDPLIRKVERPGKRLLMWAPVGLENSAIGLGDAYATDVERVVGAVERACGRLRRPVTVRDVRDEVEMDPALEPAGRLQLRSILSDISKETIDAGDGNRRTRVTRHCIYVGKVNGDSYYCHNVEEAEEARAYVRFLQIEQRWRESAAMREPTSYMTNSLPSVAVGRAMLVKAEAETLTNTIDEFLRETAVDSTTRREADSIREAVSGITEATSRWLVNSSIDSMDIPRDVSLAIPGWTAAELLEVLKPLYPAAKKLKSPNQLTPLISKKISRFPNPEFECRFSKMPHKASEYLYDRTDALLFAATRWGGHECRMQAMMARSEIGPLRDPRFVYPALKSVIFEERLRGVAGLAFLWSARGGELLRQVALNDTELGVRLSALWGYGFAGGEGAEELLRQAECDSDARARASFRDMTECLAANEGLWWKI